MPPNYTFPWHVHTPVAKLFVDEGMLCRELRGGETKILDAGDYVCVPAGSANRITCTSNQTCYLFLAPKGPFDMHLVDERTSTTTKRWRASDDVEGGSG
jgi:quercetin dioxygenase-like cupin family protein